jgi:hypothetical protein
MQMQARQHFALHLHPSEIHVPQSAAQWLQEYEADPIWKDLPPSFRHLTPRELATFPGSTWKHGWKWTTVITDMQMYMHYLMQRFVQVQQFYFQPCVVVPVITKYRCSVAYTYMTCLPHLRNACLLAKVLRILCILTLGSSHPSSFLAMCVGRTEQMALVALLLHFQWHFLLQAGGEMRHQTIGKLTELADYNILVNCGGLRAGKLFGDDKVIPVRCFVSCISGLYVKSAMLGQPGTAVCEHTHFLT